jgi:protease-4
MLYKHQILNGIWAMKPEYAANYLPLIVSFLKGEMDLNASPEKNFLSFATQNNGLYAISEYAGTHSPENAPENSIAIINITGAISKYDQDCGPAGMQSKASYLERCFNTANIKGVVLNIDSGGGSSTAMFHMNEAIARRTKPVIGFVSDSAYSAAMGIISACDLVIANNELAGVGSIGTYCTVIDYSKQLEALGVKLIDVYASESKDKNAIYHEALKGNTKPLQEQIDVFNDKFLSIIETNRKGKLTSGREVWGTGKEYFAPEAVKLGLIDAIDSFNNILNYF